MRIRWGLLMLVLFSSLASAQACHVTPGWEAMGSMEIKLQKGDEISSLQVRMADSASERAAGYQWICAVDTQNTAVLFVFPRMIPSSFHMRNVYVPLDIYFFDESGIQVDAMVMRPEPPGQDIKPRYYQPVGAFRYALEIARPQSHDLESTPVPVRLLVESLY